MSAVLEARIAQLEAELATFKTAEVPPIHPNAIYKVAEATQRIRGGKTNVYDLCKSGQLAHFNIGLGRKGIRVRGSALIAFIESREEGGPAPKQSFKYLKALN